LSEVCSEDNAAKIILDEVSTLREENETLKKEKNELEVQVANNTDVSLSELEATAQKMPGIIKAARKGREAQLNGLLLGDKPKISKYVHTKLTERYCSDAALTLSLADGEDSDFDFLMATLGNNEVPNLGEESGDQSFALADQNKKVPTKNALQLAMAKEIENSK
jgi:hypothetical protein